MGHAIKSVLCLSYALVTLGEWRMTRAVARSNNRLLESDILTQPGAHKRLLARAKNALQRALALDGLNMEIAIECRLSLARAHFLLGEIEDARAIALESQRSAETHQITRVIARARRLLGRIHALLEQHEEAEVFFSEAIELFSRHGMRLDQARALYSSGANLLQLSSSGDATYHRGLDTLRQARDIFQHCGAALDLAWVERILVGVHSGQAGI